MSSNLNVKRTPPFSRIKSSPGDMSSSSTDSVTPSCTNVEPSRTISINITNCTKATPAMENELKNLITELEGEFY